MTASNEPTSVRTRELTTGQWRVAALVATGMTNREIARQLFVSENTVKNHVACAMARVGATNRVQLALFVLQNSQEPRERRPRATRKRAELERGAWVNQKGVMVWISDDEPAPTPVGG